MEETTQQLREILRLMGFDKVEITPNEEQRKISIVIDDDLARRELAGLIPVLDHITNRILHKKNLSSCMVDVNYYRKERERLITELARAAAKKAMITKTEVRLPPMNGYERRLVHVEITTHPELRTESTGDGKDRCVIIKRIEE